jgi:hypothetical protein
MSMSSAKLWPLKPTRFMCACASRCLNLDAKILIRSPSSLSLSYCFSNIYSTGGRSRGESRRDLNLHNEAGGSITRTATDVAADDARHMQTAVSDCVIGATLDYCSSGLPATFAMLH